MTGFGAKVAIVDDGFIGYQAALFAGEVPPAAGSYIPGGGTLESTSNHGTAVAEVLADLAPDAQLYLVKVNSSSDLPFVRSWLASNGIKLVSMSLSWYGGCFWDDSCTVNDAINDSRQIDGAFWAVSAGNSRKSHRDDLSNGGQSSLSIPSGGTHNLTIYLNWDQFASGACDSVYTFLVKNKNNVNIGDPPYCIPCSGTAKSECKLDFTYVNEFAPYTVDVSRTSGPAAPTKLFCIDSGGPACVLSNFVAARSMKNGAQATYAFDVTGCDPLTYNLLCTNDVYSEGPTEGGVIKPDITAPARLSTLTISNFGGTSSSTPVVSGVTAMLKGIKPGTNPTQLDVTLTIPLAVDLGTPGKDTVWGWGRLVLTASPPSPFTFTNQCPGLGTTTLTQVSPSTAAPTTLIAVRGTGFGTSAAVFVGGKRAETFFGDPTTLTFRVPTMANGTYSLRVLNPEGCRSLETVSFTVNSSSGGGCGLIGIEALPFLFALKRRRSRRTCKRHWLVAAGLSLCLMPSQVAAGEPLQCPDGTIRREEMAVEGKELRCVKVLDTGHDTLHGPYRLLGPDGQVKGEGNHEDGVRVGTWRVWNDAGVLTAEFEWYHGVRHGREARYHANGRPSEIGYVKYDKRDGKWTRYFENGNVELEQQYLEGALSGEFKSYYENGQVQQVGQYKDGKEVGVWTSWHENGIKAEEGSAEGGLRQGEWKFWNKEGGLRETVGLDKGRATSARPSDSESIDPRVRWYQEEF